MRTTTLGLQLTRNIKLPISGLTCASCVARAESAIAGVDGVDDAAVNLATEMATVSFSSNTASNPTSNTAIPAVLQALDTAGYPVQQATTRLLIQGMSCASCVNKIESRLRAEPGVVSASVNLTTEKATVSYVARITSPASLAKLVTKFGYTALVSDKGEAFGKSGGAKINAQIDAQAETQQHVRKAREAAELRSTAILAAALTLPVFLLEMGSHFIPGIHEFIGRTLGHRTSWWIQFALISLVLAGPGRQFFTNGLPALVKARPDMNSLVVLGTTAAWGYSVLVLLAPGLFPHGTNAVYFEAAGVITTLILTGRYLEARARGKTGAAIEHLMGLQPGSALVGDNRNVATEIAINEINIGDIVHVRPGERIAVDGQIIDGNSFVDESMITGEPIAVEKHAGQKVIAGTINGNGAVSFRASAVGENTVLAQIIQLVEDAQGAKLPIQTLVDRVTGVFVPIVIGIALLTVAVWLAFGSASALAYALVAGVSVLIIACPCAMGLATPTSIMVGSGRAAELGVLFRKGAALQGLQQADIIALDKTGTLTQGQPELTAMQLTDGWSREQVLPLVAAVEASSEHPIAGAITRAAHALESHVAVAFSAVTGMGAQADVAGQHVLVGSGRFMQSEGIALEELETFAQDWSAQGKTAVYAAIDGKAVATMGVSDPLREGSMQAVAALKTLGLEVAMISGDNQSTANAVARQVGIDKVIAEVLPEGKVAAIEQLRGSNRKLAFVGDGINDAPALAHADTGIAIGTGSDIAIESADVILMSGDLRGVVNALDISQKTMRNIRQNLFWAFIYNAALIPVAAGVLYPAFGILLSPMLAAAAMALSSVFVISNALRLRGIAPLQSLSTA